MCENKGADQLCSAKTKMQISCAVTAQLIGAFVFATQTVQSIFNLNPKFQASSLLLPKFLVFSCEGSIANM